MSLHGKLQAKITPQSGWTMTLTESAGGGGQLITIPTNVYWWDDDLHIGDPDSFGLRQKIEFELTDNSANGRSYTVTLDDGEGGSGKLTISVDSGTFTLTSINSDLAALMGLDSDLSPTAASFTSPNHVEALWLPGCPSESPFHEASEGLVRSQSVPTVAPDGTYSHFAGSTVTENEITWPAVTQERTIGAAESVTGESFETFWLDAVNGRQPWATAGAGIYWFPDVDSSSAVLYNVLNTTSPDYERTVPDWDGIWRIRLELVKAV